MIDLPLALLRPLTFLILTVLASLSPLLTFTWLFQLKEWRLDRLREHLRQEGWTRSLIGKVRLLLAGCFFLWIFIGLIGVAATGGGGPAFVAFIMLLASIPLWMLTLIALSAYQIAQHRQRMPQWTSKAILIVGVALALTTIVTHLLSWQLYILFIAVLPLVQPIFVLAAWFLLLPLDRFLKHRTFQQARLIRKKLPDPIVIGIAGSVGKTTVKELLATVLADLHPLTTPEHVNTEMGVSQWLIRQASRSQLSTLNSQLLIIEMGAYRKGEIALLSSIVQPTIGVVTALGSDHLALFGSEEAIIEANGELVEALPADGHAFFYGDNPGTRSLTEKSPCPVTLAGIESHNDWRAADVNESSEGLQFSVSKIQNSKFKISTYGIHNASNALLAIAVARHLGIGDDRIRELLALHQPLRTTFHVRQENGVLLLDDTYNISPLSLRAAIDWAGTRSERPRILLTSGLLETGPAEDRFHEELGACAKGKLERVIFTTDRGRTAFAKGYGDTVELMTTATEPAFAGSALLCVGRMTPATMRRMMPPVTT